MAKKKEMSGQYSFDDYRLKEVDVRLKLMDGPAYYSNKPLSSPWDAVDVMRDVLKELDREWVCVVNMDNHLKPVNFNVVSIGSVNQSLAPIQNIFKSAILSNCNNIMLLHNHPSGDIEPSMEDRKLTTRLVEAAKLMDMQVLDHLIVGGQTGEIYSFRKTDPALFGRAEPDPYIIEQMLGEVQENKTDYHAGRKGYDPKKAAESRRNEMKDITDRLEKGVSEIFESGRYQKFLDTMAQFPKYSVNNSLLIMMQRPDASLVQSYTGWKKVGRFVKRGEKGIRILAPTPYQIDKEQEKIDQNGKTVLDQDGEPVMETVHVNMTAFKLVSTFDISQTDGKPLPTLGVNELEGTVEGYQTFFDAMQSACPVPVDFEKIPGAAKGYFDPVHERIAIREGMSEVQNIKTLIHEMTHQKLHSLDRTTGKGPEKSSSQKEVEAESTAYTVCQHYGIDTSDYSFGYIAGWSEGKVLPELKAALNTIRQAAAELITSIDEKVQELSSERNPVSLSEQISQFAADLDQYAFDRDTYDYQDAVNSREEGIQQIQEQLERGYFNEIRESIQQDLEEGEGMEDELRLTAETLLSRLDALQKELGDGREEITADGNLNPSPEMTEKTLGQDQAGKREEKGEPEKDRTVQHDRASVRQRLSEGKEKAEKSAARVRRSGEKSPER